MDLKEFYDTCAFILGVKHDFREPPLVPKMPDREGNIRNTYKNRSNGREGGNGRFPGSGIVRSFGTFIQVRLTTPPLHGNYRNFDEALKAISAAMASYIHDVNDKVRLEAEQALKDNPVGYRIAGPEEIDLSRRQLVRGNQIARETAAGLLRCPRCDRMVDRRCDQEICGYTG